MSEIQQPGKICGGSGFCGLRKFSGRSKWRGHDVLRFGQSGLFKRPHEPEAPARPSRSTSSLALRV